MDCYKLLDEWNEFFNEHFKDVEVPLDFKPYSVGFVQNQIVGRNVWTEVTTLNSKNRHRISKNTALSALTKMGGLNLRLCGAKVRHFDEQEVCKASLSCLEELRKQFNPPLTQDELDQADNELREAGLLD